MPSSTSRRSHKRQRTLFEFASSSSPSKVSRSLRRRKRSISSSSADSHHSDPGRIQFEHQANEAPHKDVDSDLEVLDTDFNSCGDSPRSQQLQKPTSVILVGSSDSSSPGGGGPAPRKRATRSRPSHRAVSESSDESDSPQPRKRRRLVKGKRPESPPLEAKDDVEDLIEEVDEDMILDSRLRDRSKKSAFAHNLERLQRRRRGQTSASENEENSDASESSSLAGLVEHFHGARPTHTILDEDENGSANEDVSDFIVEDDNAENVPELPTMFSMGTFQDLSHHFKVICQLFVHLAVKEPHRRRSFMKKALKKNYFSVPLAIARRKLSGMKDSLVASSVWKPDFKKPLETFPKFQLEQLGFSIPICDACHLGNRVATLRGTVSGHEYDTLTYEPRHALEQVHEEEPNAADWNLGRFCAARAQVFHTFTHWEHILYHTLRAEVDRLKEVTSQSARAPSNRRVFIPATNGPSPPDDLDDADGMMDWLDGRGIINGQWAKIKEMMERAHKLEAKGKGPEDDIELA